MIDQQKLLAKIRGLTSDLMKGGPQSATAVIQQALQDAGLSSASTSVPTGRRDGGAEGRATTGKQADAGAGADSVLRDINPPPAGKAVHPPASSLPHGQGSTTRGHTEPQPAAQAAAASRAAPNTAKADFVAELLSKLGVSADGTVRSKMPGRATAAPLPEGARFLSASFSNGAGSRQYKLYVPASYTGAPLPLVVMLHGCTQDPDDFAAGTQMNAAAELQQCLVLYPQQSQGANSSKCWNWFNVADQQRDAGEPSIIAGMTREVMAQYAVDPRQVFVAGLSAGGAMAAIMGTTYPDLYAGVAVHSGLPYGAATDLPSALAAMNSGVTKSPPPRSQSGAFKGIPIIVFHGDADRTVNQKNGEQVLASAAPATTGGNRTRLEGRVDNGHAYTRTVQHDVGGKPVAEHWLIHGFGHAWAGGSANGSYTDARGPDATGEMMRFFYTQARSQ